MALHQLSDNQRGVMKRSPSCAATAGVVVAGGGHEYLFPGTARSRQNGLLLPTMVGSQTSAKRTYNIRDKYNPTRTNRVPEVRAQAMARHPSSSSSVCWMAVEIV